MLADHYEAAKRFVASVKDGNPDLTEAAAAVFEVGSGRCEITAKAPNR